MQKLCNIIFGLFIIWIINVGTVEYALTLLFVTIPFLITVNRGEKHEVLYKQRKYDF
jgi:hypothetical protein